MDTQSTALTALSQSTTLTTSQSASVPALSQDLVYPPLQRFFSDANMLNSQTPDNISLPKNTMLQSNNTSPAEQTILDPSQHFIFQSQNESGQATILNAQQLASLPKDLILKLTNDNSPAVTLQILDESIASIEEELTSLSQPAVYSDAKLVTPSGKKRKKSRSSVLLDQPSQTCHDLKPPDVLKKVGSKKRIIKKKKGSVTDLNKSNNSSDGKRQARTKKNKNMVVDDQSTDNGTSVIRNPKVSEICLPVHGISTCTNVEHGNVMTSIANTVNCGVNKGVNVVDCGINNEISKVGHISEKPDGKNINDVFISKYWK